MKRTLRLLPLILFVAFTLHCGTRPDAGNQPKAPTSTQNSEQPQVTKTPISFGGLQYRVGNGRGWNQLEKGSKQLFIEGMISGIVATLQRSSDKLDSKSTGALTWLMSAGEKHNLSDLIQQIDTFYSDSANVNIPILE